MEFIEGKDYYLKDGAIVFTARYLKKRGTCCGSGCLHCPFEPHHTKGTETLKEEKK